MTAIAHTSTRTGDVLPATRAGIGLLLLLAIANGAFLYFFPSHAEADYAWAIAPAISAAVMGAGYLAGALATGLAAFVATRFRSFRVFLPSFVVLSLSMLVATIIHGDRFRWDYVPTYGWTVVYAGIPVAVAVLWWLQERAAAPAPPRDPAFRPIAVGSVIAAVVLGVAGVALFVAPDGLLDRWPWDLTPLLARVFGGWYLFSATTLAFGALSVRQLSEVPIPYVTVAAWSLLQLPLPALYADSVESGGALVGFLVLHAAVATGCFAAVAISLRRMGRQGDSL